MRRYSSYPSYILWLYCSLIAPFNSVDSLRKLHRKTKLVDANLEERGSELSTIRAVWAEVVDNTDRGMVSPINVASHRLDLYYRGTNPARSMRNSNFRCYCPADHVKGDDQTIGVYIYNGIEHVPNHRIRRSELARGSKKI